MRIDGIQQAAVRRPIILVALVLILGCNILAAGGAPSTADTTTQAATGAALRTFLDSQDLAHLWQKGWRIDWYSGKGLWKWPRDGKLHTHCSAFVASVCSRLNIPLPTPANNSERGLADRQALWLQGKEGAAAGWRGIAITAAQAVADSGELVVVCLYQKSGPGHIGIIRPLEKDSLFVAQAGKINGARVPLPAAFAAHRGAVENGLIEFYAHPVPMEKSP